MTAAIVVCVAAMRGSDKKMERYSVGMSREDQNQPSVETFYTLKSAREFIAFQKSIGNGSSIKWLCNINTGREHKF